MKKLLWVYRYYRERVSREDTSSLSYYLLLSLVPAFTLVLLIVDGLQLDLALLETLFPARISSLLHDFLFKFIRRDGIHYLSIVSLVISLYVASQGFFSMQLAMNRLYEKNEIEGIIHYLKRRGISMFETILFILLIVGLIFMMGILPTITIVFDIILVSRMRKYLYLFLFVLLIVLMLNLIMPSFRLKISEVIYGSLLSSGGILLIAYGLSFYLRYASYETIYGPLASIAMILLALNLFSHAIYVGACLNAYLYLRKGRNSCEKGNTNN